VIERRALIRVAEDALLVAREGGTAAMLPKLLGQPGAEPLDVLTPGAAAVSVTLSFGAGRCAT
jgi:hypothetical protein